MGVLLRVAVVVMPRTLLGVVPVVLLRVVAIVRLRRAAAAHRRGEHVGQPSARRPEAAARRIRRGGGAVLAVFRVAVLLRVVRVVVLTGVVVVVVVVMVVVVVRVPGIPGRLHGLYAVDQAWRVLGATDLDSEQRISTFLSFVRPFPEGHGLALRGRGRFFVSS